MHTTVLKKFLNNTSFSFHFEIEVHMLGLGVTVHKCV